MQRFNGIQLDPLSRREVAQTALEIGSYKTAKRYGINPKTVLLWRKRHIEGGKFTNEGVSPISSKEKRRILNLARKFGVGTINSFRRKHNIDRSDAAIYNLFVRSRLNREEIKIVIYSCLDCSREYKAVALYWGIPIAPECPTCGGTLSIRQSYRLSFLGKGKGLYSIRCNNLLPITIKEVSSIRESRAPPKSHYPKYIDLVDRSEHLTHILKALGRDSNLFFCGLSFPSSRRIHPYTAQSKIHLDCESLCPKCVEKTNLLLNAGKSLKPLIISRQEDKGELKREIITVGVLSGNISKTCEMYGIARSTFYYNLNKFKRLQPGVLDSIDQRKAYSQKVKGKALSIDLNTLTDRIEDRAR